MRVHGLGRTVALVSAWLLPLEVGAGPPAELKKVPDSARRPGSMAQANEIASPDDLICTYERMVGSQIKRRICMTRAEREALAKAGENAITSYHRDRSARDKATEGSGRGLTHPTRR